MAQKLTFASTLTSPQTAFLDNLRALVRPVSGIDRHPPSSRNRQKGSPVAKILEVKYENQAQARVCEVAYESQADLCFHEVAYDTQAVGDIAWFFVAYEKQASFRIFKVKYETQADLKIFKVKYPEQAGWRTTGHALKGKLG